MSRRDASGAEPGGVGGWVVASAIAGTVLIALGAFWLSFTSLADLAYRAGVPAGLSWVWPLIVDGVIVVATISVVALSRHGTGATRYAWALLAGGAAVSVSANVLHSTVTAHAEVPAVLAAMVAGIPPVVLLAITHLTVILTRYRASSRGSASPAGAQVQVLSHPLASARPKAPGVSEQEQASLWPVMVSQVARALPAPDGPPSTRTDAPSRERAGRLRAQGWSNRRIAAELGVHPATIGRWLRTPSATGESAETGEE